MCVFIHWFKFSNAADILELKIGLIEITNTVSNVILKQ